MLEKEKDAALRDEYTRSDRLWSSIYYKYDLFKSQYDACVNRWLYILRYNDPTRDDRPEPRPLPPDEKLPPREPSQKVKQQVKQRDRYKCLCCGLESRIGLQVDHINTYYFGGSNPLDNLQTLCSTCNRLKKTKTINFRNQKTTLSEPPISWHVDGYPTGHQADDLTSWTRFVSRNVNFFYQCAAVGFVEIGKRGDRFYNWRISLNAGNNPIWAKHMVKVILLHAQRERERIKCRRPETITISSPGFDDITVK